MMFLQYRISLFFLLLFLLLFLPLQNNKKLIACSLLMCYAATGVIEYLLFLNGITYENPIIHTLLEIVIIQAVPFIISRYRDFRAMFVGFTAAAYVLTGNIVCSTLYIIGASLPVNVICQCMVHILLLGILTWKIRRNLLISLENKELQWGSFCIIPALFYTATYALSTWPANIYMQPQNLLGVCAILVLMAIAYIMIFQTFARSKQEIEQKRSMEYLENYASRLKYEAEVTQKKEMEAAIIRHDLKHYSILINSYLGEGKEDEIRKLLKELNEHVNETKSVRYCKNLAVNSVVANYAQQAQEQGIAFDADMEVPSEMAVNEFEFATVISNLLDNAVNAAAQVKEEKLRFVKISARGVKGKLILSISNGCTEEPKISAETGLPVSKGGKEHGYGMQSVRAFVKKNRAVFDFQVKEGIFSVKLLFDIEE
ncbi:MAG: GHKL domain-containing protein [Eubacteriales bacterium]|nr:GHKL domain-containing protein [Eubacteriales bacterium]